MDNVVGLKSKLDQHQLSILASEMEKNKKSTGLAYVLCFFLGTLGIHKFYIGKIGMGVTYLILGLVGWISLIVGVASSAITDVDVAAAGMAGGLVFSTIVFAVIGIFLLIDLFTIPGQIRKSYEAKELKCINDLFSTQPTTETIKPEEPVAVAPSEEPVQAEAEEE